MTTVSSNAENTNEISWILVFSSPCKYFNEVPTTSTLSAGVSEVCKYKSTTRSYSCIRFQIQLYRYTSGGVTVNSNSTLV